MEVPSQANTNGYRQLLLMTVDAILSGRHCNLNSMVADLLFSHSSKLDLTVFALVFLGKNLQEAEIEWPAKWHSMSMDRLTYLNLVANSRVRCKEFLTVYRFLLLAMQHVKIMIKIPEIVIDRFLRGLSLRNLALNLALTYLGTNFVFQLSNIRLCNVQYSNVNR